MIRWLALFVIALLGGCTLLPPTPAPAVRPVQAESFPFTLNGRIAVNYNGSRHSAGLRWIHTAQSDEILLLAPLGQTAAHIYCDARNATLNDGDQEYRADNVEALMQQVLGWYLPLRGLHHWVLGLSESVNPAQIERNINGQIATLQQDGWAVLYQRYADNQPDSLPTRLQLKREVLQVQLLIDEWAFP